MCTHKINAFIINEIKIASISLVQVNDSVRTFVLKISFFSTSL